MNLRPIYIVSLAFTVLCIALMLIPKASVNSKPNSNASTPLPTKKQDDTPSERSFKSVSKQNDVQRRITLESVKKIDDHPLYFMKYVGDYEIDPRKLSALEPDRSQAWACSIFFSFADKSKPLFGRNFDWQDEPVVVLFTNPPDRYASVSMVDVSYIGFPMNQPGKFEDVESRTDLVEATQLPFDGMNEHGLTIGMAAVANTEVVDDPDRPNARSLQIIRLALDTAKTTAEAMELFKSYDIEFSGGPNIHYLIADPSGHSVLIEVKDGKVYMHENNGGNNQDTCWQTATNFYITGEKNPARQCWRFAKIQKRLAQEEGVSTVEDAMKLLGAVSQGSTRWSVVYEMDPPAINIVMSRKYKQDFHRFAFDSVFPVETAK